MRSLVPLPVLHAALGPDRTAVLDDRCARVRRQPDLVGRVFPAAAREIGRGPLPGDRPVTVEDAVRVELLRALAAATPPEELLTPLRALYRFGDNDEKRAVLHGLSCLPPDGPEGTDLLDDALRTNDPRLVAAALGPHARHLDADAWRQGVLKCLFVGVPVAQVADLGLRADATLTAMVGRYAHERTAAGRDVPPDVRRVLDACPVPQES